MSDFEKEISAVWYCKLTGPSDMYELEENPS